MPEDLVRDRTVNDCEQTLSPDDVPELSLNVRMRNYRGSHFISCMGRVFEINPSGWSILMAVDGSRSVYEIACEMSRTHQVPVGDALEEVMAFIAELGFRGVVNSGPSMRKTC